MAMTDQKTLLVLGGTSDIGRACALVFAEHGWAICLAARDAEALARDAQDLAVRTKGSVTRLMFDVLDTAAIPRFIEALPTLPDVVVCAVGILGDEALARTNPDQARAVFRTNFEGPALVLEAFAERFSARGSGTIVGISSVAGDRGRSSNYVYGSAKAGFSAYLSGLRNRLGRHGVHVVTVKPGFVRTKMTEGLKLPAPITADPHEVGKAVWRAVGLRRDVIYVRPVWRLVMTIIRLIPEPIFKRLSL